MGYIQSTRRVVLIIWDKLEMHHKPVYHHT